MATESLMIEDNNSHLATRAEMQHIRNRDRLTDKTNHLVMGEERGGDIFALCCLALKCFYMFQFSKAITT